MASPSSLFFPIYQPTLTELLITTSKSVVMSVETVNIRTEPTSRAPSSRQLVAQSQLPMVGPPPSSFHRRSKPLRFLGRLYDTYTDCSRTHTLASHDCCFFLSTPMAAFDLWDMLYTPWSIFNKTSEVWGYPRLLGSSLLRAFTSPLYSCC